ncbi:hypothetical protein D3C78_869460 [compost metagenome]
MQCPECNHTPAPSEQPDPARCPSCGLYYHKAMAKKLRETEAARAKAEEALAQRSTRPLPAMSSTVREALGDNLGASPVVVVDLSMSFRAMVRFMVKWVLASIPAMFILFMLVVGFMAIMGLLGQLFR